MHVHGKHTKYVIIISQSFCRHFEMKLIKRNNYPPYILDTVDRTVLEDDNGNPFMVSHFFDQQELGCSTKNGERMTFTLKCAITWHVTFTYVVL